MQLRHDTEALYCPSLPILAMQPNSIYFHISSLTLKLTKKKVHMFKMYLSNEVEQFILKRIDYILMSRHILHGTQHTVRQINIQ